MRNHQLAANQTETIVIGNINEINKRKLNSFYSSLEAAASENINNNNNINTACDENQNKEERLRSSSSYYASPPLNGSSLEKDASNAEAYLLGTSLSGNMDVIKEFRSLFLKDYLEKNKLGRKSKISSSSPNATGFISRSWRKSSTRRSIDKESMNDANKKEFEAFQNDVFKNNIDENNQIDDMNQTQYSLSYSENNTNNQEYSNYQANECINNLLSGHYLGSSVPLSSNKVIHHPSQSSIEESLIVPVNSFQSGYFSDSYHQYHNSYLQHLHHQYQISRGNENKLPRSPPPLLQPPPPPPQSAISSFYSTSYGNNNDENTTSNSYVDNQYFAVEQQQRMLYRQHNTPRRRNFATTAAASDSLSESFSENHTHTIGVDYHDQTKIFNFDVENRAIFMENFDELSASIL